MSNTENLAMLDSQNFPSVPATTNGPQDSTELPAIENLHLTITPNASELPARDVQKKINLLDLPLEIKHQIYEYLLSKIVYLILPPSNERIASSRLSKDFAILQVSKQANREAVDVLLSKAIFNYYDRDLYHDMISPSASDKPTYITREPLREATRRMMNIEFRKDLDWFMKFWSPQREVREFTLSVALLDKRTNFAWWIKQLRNFSGDEILRNSIRINFTNCQWYTLQLILPRMAILEGIKKLIGFAEVVVDVTEADNIPIISLVSDAIISLGYDGEAPACAILAAKLQEFLEPALGPAQPWSTPSPEDTHRRLTFRPRDYLAEKLKSEMERDGGSTSTATTE